ncbi:TPA: hypothetical protein HA265_05215 [Candidatus Woesearchaeota archaeon]|nr:hypothetical protein [Candidatus Woesearchaeota archaeon]
MQMKVASQKKVNLVAKQEFFGEAPNVFVGRYGYPNINVGLLSVEHYDNHDEPLKWSADGVGIQQVIDYRTALVNSSFKAQVKSFDNRFLEMTQEVSLAAKPVDVEISLNKKPHFSLSLSQDTMPHGPNVKLEKARITENVKVPTQVERAVGDTDLKAADAVAELRKKFDEHYLTKILSVGNLGLEQNRKLVPTRWSITAVDDMIGKEMIEEVKKYPESDHMAFFGGYLGNYYIILTFPEVWRYELFETAVSEKMSFSTDYEDHGGRKEYAFETAGGYYAARHAILERLSGLKRQASVLCLRFITSEYWAPLGVWVVREATRNAMKSRPLMFDDKELMLKYAKALVKKKFGLDLEVILKGSRLLHQLKTQKTLKQFV